jgi:UDP-4-amino-4,6-dideoxy-N-acetyl-beta-L-altrosamine transaminase
MIPYGHQWIDEEDIEAVRSVLTGEWITTGPKIGEFEDVLAGYLGTSLSAVAVNSGTSALDIAVQALGLPRGSEVITTPFTFAATSNAILYNGLRPAFADITPGTRNLDPERVREKISGKTRAIIAVDYAGHPCGMDELREIAGERDLVLIDDACHALGAEYRGRKIGSIADMTIFSFHPVKHITTGEGGAVVTGDRDLAERLRMLRNHGIDRSALERSASRAGWAYDIRYLGRNYRMTDFQAALGISQMGKLDRFLGRREGLAQRYHAALRDLPGLALPSTEPGVRHAWHLYTVLLEGMDRDLFFEGMRERSIGVNVHYIPIYRFSYYRNRFRISPRAYPNTEEIFRKIVTLPLFPLMTDAMQDRVVDAVEEVLGTSG